MLTLIPKHMQTFKFMISFLCFFFLFFFWVGGWFWGGGGRGGGGGLGYVTHVLGES